MEVIDGNRLPLAVAGWLPANAPADQAEQVARATGLWADRFRAHDDAVARTHTAIAACSWWAF